MANEGSTKPTLNCGHPAELLIKSVESTYQFCELCEMRSERNDAVQMEAHYKSELARVRGLLQRQWISVRERLPEDDTDVLISVVSSGERYTWAGCVLDGQWFMSNNYANVKGFVTDWQPFPDFTTFPQSSSLVPQGAESADIGKLDRVDEKSNV